LIEYKNPILNQVSVILKEEKKLPVGINGKKNNILYDKISDLRNLFLIFFNLK